MSIKQYNDAGTFSTTLSAQPTANRTITVPDVSGALALVDSQVFTGTPTAPTATAGTSTTQLATTAMVHSAITNDLNVTGTAPMYACRAWVNYNSYTPAIRASGNISSVTKNATGDFTINFTTAMPDANYSAAFASSTQNGRYLSNYNGTFNNVATAVANTTTSFRFIDTDPTGNLLDVTNAYVTIFR